MRALTRASRAFYEHPPSGFCDTPLLSRRGALYVAMHGQEELLADTARELTTHGGAIEQLDAAATLARVPRLRPELVHGALFEAAAERYRRRMCCIRASCALQIAGRYVAYGDPGEHRSTQRWWLGHWAEQR